MSSYTILILPRSLSTLAARNQVSTAVLSLYTLVTSLSTTIVFYTSDMKVGLSISERFSNWTGDLISWYAFVSTGYAKTWNSRLICSGNSALSTESASASMNSDANEQGTVKRSMYARKNWTTGARAIIVSCKSHQVHALHSEECDTTKSMCIHIQTKRFPRMLPGQLPALQTGLR